MKKQISKCDCKIGHKVTAETRTKISTTLIGHKVTDETKAKLRIARLGYKFSPETIIKFKNRKHTEETKAKMRIARLGKKLSDETKAKIKGRPNCGLTEKHNGLRVTQIHRDWSKQIKEKANYTCQLCGRKPPEVKIIAHHILPFAKFITVRTESANGMCLCEEHHQLVHRAMREV